MLHITPLGWLVNFNTNTNKNLNTNKQAKSVYDIICTVWSILLLLIHYTVFCDSVSCQSRLQRGHVEPSLTHCRLDRLSHTIYWKSPISILGMSSYEIYIFLEKMAKLFANSGDPDQTPHSVASDQGLHYLSITLLRVFRLQIGLTMLLTIVKNQLRLSD